MKRRLKRWKKFLLPASGIIFGGTLLIILEETIRLKNTGFETKTLWDWMELLIVPAVLAGGAFYLNRSERNTDREIATDRQREAALQTYLDQMADLLLKENLRIAENEEVQNVARARTLTVLRGLDKTRKAAVLKYLYDVGLIGKEKTIVSLKGADLSGADLMIADLKGANLSGALLWDADLEEVDLSDADLRDFQVDSANLHHADLSGANLSGAYLGLSFAVQANLSGADLSSIHSRNTFLNSANLSRAKLTSASLIEADLSDANLSDADLSNAILKSANFLGAQMTGANLAGVDLTGAKISNEQLATASSLKDATMPDGRVHE